MKIVIPDTARFIIDKLYEYGHEAYVVGGCVRDCVLGIKPKDWDITTSASPLEVKKIFERTIDTGIKHGTVTVLIDKVGYEVTTYRIDGEYTDSRHPKDVVFTKELKEDLRRRDFTINAMAYNDKVGLVDVFEGLKDLDRKIIRCVGEPNERFHEDALRILRAIRFSAQLGFDIEDETKKAMKAYARTLENISAERIKVEMDKTLLSRNPQKIYEAYELGITKVFLSEFDNMFGVLQENPNHMYDVGNHTLKAVIEMSRILREERPKKIDDTDITDKEKLVLMWTILLHDIGKPSSKTVDDKHIAHFKMHEIVGVDMASKVYRRLKFDNYTSDLSKKLIKWHDYRFTNKLVNIRRAMNKIGPELFDLLFLIKKADILAQNLDTIEEKLEELEKSHELYREVYMLNQCVTLKDLKVDGLDLIENGVKPGKEIGVLLAELLKIVIENPNLNEKDILLEKLKELK